MDLRFLLMIFAFIYFITLTVAPPAPVDQKHVLIPGAGENEIEENVVEGVKDDKKVDAEIDELGLEYGRYLQEVVKALDEDPEFSKKLENITHDQIMGGHVARHIESVAPDVRNKLDELKRIELDRLRKLAMKEHNLEEEMAREQNDGNEIDGRRWRSVKGNTNTKNIHNILDDKNAAHLDHQNPHTFEAEDLQKLIMQATQDLEELDRKRRRDFKQYEMEKEINYRDGLQNMTAEQKVEAEKKHNEEKVKHNNHPHVNNPGSKHQFEQVWEEQDHMQKQEFDPKIFFQMHDINGDGFLDQEEVEALLGTEVRKLYNEKDPSYDKREMYEEYHRMREHIYKEIDTNHDGLISKKEFLDYTKSPEFEKDEGWKGIEDAPVYTEEELKHYEQQRAQLQDHYAKYGAYQMPYQPGMEMDAYGQPIYYQQHPGAYPGGHPMDPNHPGNYPGNYQGHPMDPQHPGNYPGNYQGGHPMDPQHPANYPGGHPQQVQYVQVPAQHMQQQQMHPSQMQYQQLPPGQHPAQQQQQYMAPNPNLAQLPPSSQQPPQHPQQQQMYNPPPPPQMQQHPNQPPPQPMYQQGQQVPPQQQQQPQGHYAVPPAQVNQHAPPPQQQQQQPPQMGVPNPQSQQVPPQQQHH